MTLQWTSGAYQYYLYVGSSQGASDYYNSGYIPGSTTSRTVSGLPTDGSTIHVRFWYQDTSSSGWAYTDYTYTAYSGYRITSPTPGSTLTGSSMTLQWTSGAYRYYLYVGSSQGASDYYNSGYIPGSTTSRTVSGLPTDGSTIHVRFWYQDTSSSGWAYTDYTYTAYTGTGTFKITSPTPGSTLSGSTVTFQWTSGAYQYWLYVGSSVGSYSYHNSGLISGSTTSRTVSGLPTDGSTVYVRLWYRASSTSSWQYSDYKYTAASGTASIAGTWFVQEQYDMGWTGSAEWVITQSGTSISVVATRTATGEVSKGSGTYSRGRISLTYPCFGTSCGSATYKFTGTVSGNSMSGDVVYGTSTTGTWTASKTTTKAEHRSSNPGSGGSNPGL
jgi:hypothetical protein